MLTIKSHSISRVAFAPIIPHPATEFNTIYTATVNFQDVLPHGPLWSDEGVYRIAKELQLQYPEKLNNFFLGIAGFQVVVVVTMSVAKELCL